METEAAVWTEMYPSIFDRTQQFQGWSYIRQALLKLGLGYHELREDKVSLMVNLKDGIFHVLCSTFHRLALRTEV